MWQTCTGRVDKLVFLFKSCLNFCPHWLTFEAIDVMQRYTAFYHNEVVRQRSAHNQGEAEGWVTGFSDQRAHHQQRVHDGVHSMERQGKLEGMEGLEEVSRVHHREDQG